MNVVAEKTDVNKLATGMNGVGTELVRAALVMPPACSPEHATSVETASPGLFEFEQEEKVRMMKELEEKLQFEREAKRHISD